MKVSPRYLHYELMKVPVGRYAKSVWCSWWRRTNKNESKSSGRKKSSSANISFGVRPLVLPSQSSYHADSTVPVCRYDTYRARSDTWHMTVFVVKKFKFLFSNDQANPDFKLQNTTFWIFLTKPNGRKCDLQVLRHQTSHITHLVQIFHFIHRYGSESSLFLETKLLLI